MLTTLANKPYQPSLAFLPQALRAISHENIVKCKELLLDRKGYVHMVFELLEGGNLEAFNRKHRGSPLTEPHIRSIFYQLLRAISYMHSMRHMHRDIKPENILLQSNAATDNIKIKVADLGLAKLCESAKPRPHTTYVATRWYRSPEILLRISNYSFPSDLWAVGAVMAEVVCRGEPLFPGDDERDQLARIIALRGHPAMVGWQLGEITMNERHIRLPKTTPSSLRSVVPLASLPVLQLISDLLEMDPARRPSASEALGYPLFVSHRPENYIRLPSGKRQRLDGEGLDTARTRDYPSSRWTAGSQNEDEILRRGSESKRVRVKALLPSKDTVNPHMHAPESPQYNEKVFNIPSLLDNGDNWSDSTICHQLGRRSRAGKFDLGI